MPHNFLVIPVFELFCETGKKNGLGRSVLCMYEKRSNRDFWCRLGAIIEATGASTYHGFLPSLVRDCVASFTLAKGGVATADTGAGEFPLSFATALFSFLYHLATYEASEWVTT